MKTKSLTGTVKSRGPGSGCDHAPSCIAKKSQGYDIEVSIIAPLSDTSRSAGLPHVSAAEMAATSTKNMALKSV